MKAVAGIVGGLVVGAVIGYGVATQVAKKNAAPSASTASQAVTSAPAPTADAGKGATGGELFELDGVTYSSADLPTDVKSELFEAQVEAHERMKQMLNQAALHIALAKEKDPNAKIDALPPFEDLLGVTPPTDDEIKALYEQNKARLPKEMTMEQVKPELQKYLVNQKKQDSLRAKNQALLGTTRFKVLVPAPESPQIPVDIAGFPTKGKKVDHVLVEVADYVCPHCQAMQPEVDALMKEMDGKVQLVQVPYALNPAGLSGMLARGAWCAQKQGDEMFWKFHDTTFRIARTKGWKASDPEAKAPLEEVAKEAGLDSGKLVACVDGPEAAAFLKSNEDKWQRLGVTGTPTFFLDNRKVLIHAKSLRDLVAEALGMKAS